MSKAPASEAVRQKWEERVREWKATGQTAGEFASTRGFSPATLKWWECQLSQSRTPRLVQLVAGMAPARPVDRMRRRRREPSTVNPAREDKGAAHLVVEVGEARIRVTAGFSDVLLRELVDALSAVRP